MIYLPDPPSRISEAETSRHLLYYLIVKDADTGEVITLWLEADVAARQVKRFRKKEQYQLEANEHGEPIVFTETRNLRIEWTQGGIDHLTRLIQYGMPRLTEKESEFLSRTVYGLVQHNQRHMSPLDEFMAPDLDRLIPEYPEDEMKSLYHKLNEIAVLSAFQEYINQLEAKTNA